MHLESLGPDVVLASEAVRDAALFMRSAKQDAVGYTFTKADATPVTTADFVVQAVLASRLARHFPSDPLVAEEDASALRAEAASDARAGVVALVRQMLPDTMLEAEQVLSWIDRGRGACGRRFWTLDPIDGTKGFLKGGHYAIALALVVDGTVQIGVLGCPQTGSPEQATVAGTAVHGEGGVAIAVRHRGAWWMPLHGSSLKRLSVSTESNPTRTRVLHSREPRHSDMGELQRVLRSLGSHESPILMDGQTKQVLLSAGAAELLMRIPLAPDYREAIWDEAAGSLLVEEAGGRVTDLDGLPLDFTQGRLLLRNRGVVASNGFVHDAVLDVIRQRAVS